jgi:hypothetical protein
MRLGAPIGLPESAAINRRSVLDLSSRHFWAWFLFKWADSNIWFDVQLPRIGYKRTSRKGITGQEEIYYLESCLHDISTESEKGRVTGDLESKICPEPRRSLVCCTKIPWT